jgi:hypothetical protein
MHGYLNEFLCDLRGLSLVIARADPASLDWATHKLERIHGILGRQGIRTEREALGVEPLPAGPDPPEYDETMLCYYFDHVSESADAALRWGLHLHTCDKKPVEVEVRVMWDNPSANKTDSRWEWLRGSRRRWIHHLVERPETAVPKRRAFEIVDRMAARMAAIKGIPTPR